MTTREELEAAARAPLELCAYARGADQLEAAELTRDAGRYLFEQIGRIYLQYNVEGGIHDMMNFALLGVAIGRALPAPAPQPPPEKPPIWKMGPNA